MELKLVVKIICWFVRQSIYSLQVIIDTFISSAECKISLFCFFAWLVD